MGYLSAVQVFQQAEDLKIKVLQSRDLLNESNAWTDHQKLQNIYHRILILDLEYALDKKVEQDLWNIGFKNCISTLQELVRDKKNTRRSECQSLLNWCLESASGFYISLLQELCNAFDIELPFRKSGKVFGQFKETPQDQLNLPQTWSCLYICQYCLVHLGDIARYRNQRVEAETFYKQAIQVSSTSGHPYNQLALLEASSGNKLSTVFYYIRGIAVKNPFPAATTNLLSTLTTLVDKENNSDCKKLKITSNEFINLFLKCHAYSHTFTNLDKAAEIGKNLGNVMTALVATESFSIDKLLKMIAINIYALKHVDDGQTQDEKKMFEIVMDLFAGSLSAFLVPVHTLKADETLTEYYALPAVNIALQWVRNNEKILLESVFRKWLQIWSSFSKLLNNIQIYLNDFQYENYKDVPLPEDKMLEGFLPLNNYLKQFDYNRKEPNKETQNLIRLKRILDFGLWITEQDDIVNKLMTKNKNDENWKFEPGSIQPDPTNDLLEEIKSININKAETVPFKSAEKKAGILKPQGSLEKAREERENLSATDSVRLEINNSASAVKNENSKMKRAKQNAALQSIYKKMEENKQVKFNVEEKSKDKSIKFDTHKPSIVPTNSSNQFGLPVRQSAFNQTPTQSPIQNFSPVANQQDYLATLRNMAGNSGYGMGGGMNFGGQNMFGNMPGGQPTNWGGQPGFKPMGMGAMGGGFDSPQGQNWWNNQSPMMPQNPMGQPSNQMGQSGMMSPYGMNMGMPKMDNKMPTNQASGDAYSPWSNYGGNYGFGQGNQGFDGNMSMRQQMLKEANMPANINEKFVSNHQNSSQSYSLFNTSWNPNLPGQLRNLMGPPENNFTQAKQQSSLFNNYQSSPQSLDQLLEQQNQKK